MLGVLFFSSASFKPDSLAPKYYFSYPVCISVRFTQVHILELSLLQNNFFTFSEEIKDDRDRLITDSTKKIKYSGINRLYSGRWELLGDTLLLFPKLATDSVSTYLWPKKIEIIVNETGKSLRKVGGERSGAFPKIMTAK